SGTIQSGSGSDSSNSTQSGSSALPELKEEDEFHPQRSQETQEQGYPTGPVLIYDSGVYLYLEPTAEEASNFDTVINVAKEIKTPFEIEAPILEISEPQTAISEISFKSAWEWPRASETPTPTTPRPTPFLQKKQPEYMHIPWDHNSEILEDLYNLCRVIDERVQAGKKVLVHCQLGVSRSASLVIAYGLYKGYQPDFHSMYMSVKQRSQWVGPNMSLIYQLTDFRSRVVKGVYGDHTFNPKPTWWKVQDSSSPVMDTPIAKKSFQQLPSQSWERPAM
ncbi:tyrosine/serine/threonine protein phosphatase, partial [Exophiala xenobiotica]